MSLRAVLLMAGWGPRAALASLLLLGAAPAPTPPALVLLSIDGLRPDYVLEADRHGLRIPNLRRLLREGAHATGVAGVLPTVTYPSHTTIVTGVSPARHGILANGPFDPTGKNLDGWYWYAEDIQVETLWDVAREAGLTTANLEWPATAGARVDWNIPQYWRAKTADDLKLHRLLVTPGLLAEAEPLLGPYPPSYEWTVEYDVKRAAYGVFLLERKRPRVLLAYFAGLDEEEHASGPFSPGTFAVLEKIDGLVGRLREAAEKNGPTVFAVVSDHGFNRTEKELNLNEALRAEGLLQVDARGRVTEWRAAAWNTGGSAAIMLRDPDDAEARRAVERVIEGLRSHPEKPVRILAAAEVKAAGAFTGAAYVVGAMPGVRIGGSFGVPVLRGAAVRGAHGMLPEDRNMDAAFFVAGPGIPGGRSLGRIDMRDVGPTLAARLGLVYKNAEGRDLLR